MAEIKQENTHGITFDDFLAMFLRGIIKDLVEGIFKEVTKNVKKDTSSHTGESMFN